MPTKVSTEISIFDFEKKKYSVISEKSPKKSECFWFLFFLIYLKNNFEIRINTICGHPLYASNDMRMIALAWKLTEEIEFEYRKNPKKAIFQETIIKGRIS